MHTAEADAARTGAATATPAERLAMYLGVLRRCWRLVVGIVAVALLSGAMVAAFAPESHEATAKLLIGQRAQVDALLGATDYTPDPERDVNTNLELITLEPVAERVSAELDLGLPPAALTSKVATEVAGNSNVVSITASDRSPQTAARIANAFADAYRDFRTRSARASIDDAVASAEQRAAALAPGAERAALTEELRGLQAAAAFQTGGVQIVRRATPASAVASGGTMSTALVAGFLGVVLAAVAVVLVARTDQRVRGEADLEAAAGSAVLATVSDSPAGGGSTGARDAFATLALSLSLRGLRSRESVRARRNGHAARVLLLVSPGPGEGTTEVALGLALALRDMGETAIAIEADLRGPGFAEQLRLGPVAGVAGILSGASTLDDELVELAGTPGGSPAAWAVPAGSALGLPQPMLAGPAMRALVSQARARAAVVILAGAPAALFGDSFALTRLADEVLLVARIDATRRDDVARVVAELKELERPPLGAVATRGRIRRPVFLGAVDVARPASNGSVPASSTPSEVTAR
jgi:capsular polysaccharide biosynthesis protein/MinD-like ATPase involved in chromosome partitioning or flagellar assembly